MTRPRFVWLAFVACVGTAAAALGWVSGTVLDLERAEARAVRQSENERLALWRMDSLLVPLIARESARPPVDYRVQPPSSPTDKPADDSQQFVILHFQCATDGKFSSPNAQSKNPLADVACYEDLAVAAPRRSVPLAEGTSIPFVEPYDPQAAQKQTPQSQIAESEDLITQQLARPLQQKFQQETARSFKEYANRSKAAYQGNSVLNGYTVAGPSQQAASASSDDLVEGPMRGLWVHEFLVLVRPAKMDGADVVQGCLLDWSTIRDQLLKDIRDLLPEAKLVPTNADPNIQHALRLAALPVQLVPGVAPLDPVPFLTPIRVSLALAWTCLLLAAAAVGVLLFCAMRLSERRGSFVSAVTHELRTPLTTFRLYAEMLAEGMVPTEEKRRHYLQTLRVEADRLGHLVENVLSYARLENTRGPSARERVDIAELITRLEEPMQERAARSEMQLEIECPAGAALVAHTDAAAVERILFNLIDNACKYGGADERRVRLTCRRDSSRVTVSVRDYGRGISRSETKRLFRPFSKSAREAAHSAPGVGLGLALCRRLARSMGGDLTVDHTVDDGACLVLSLPAA